MKGTQHRIECPKCGKAFFAWRPDELKGAAVKCYFCGNQFEDAAARRPAPPPPPPAPAATPATSTAPGEPAEGKAN